MDITFSSFLQRNTTYSINFALIKISLKKEIISHQTESIQRSSRCSDMF